MTTRTGSYFHIFFNHIIIIGKKFNVTVWGRYSSPGGKTGSI